MWLRVAPTEDTMKLRLLTSEFHPALAEGYSINSQHFGKALRQRGTVL
jgi:hypothetical protein